MAEYDADPKVMLGDRGYDIDAIRHTTSTRHASTTRATVLAALVDAVLRAEAPIRDERLAQRIARAHGFQRTGRRVREAVLAIVPGACATTREDDAVFVWPSGVAPASWSAFRAPGPGAPREPAEMPIEELMVLASRVLLNAAGEETALVQMRDACGLIVLREAARARCLAAIRKVQAGGS